MIVKVIDLFFNCLAMGDYGREKAGVGGCSRRSFSAARLAARSTAASADYSLDPKVLGFHRERLSEEQLWMYAE
jgi:hypothetical protein